MPSVMTYVKNKDSAGSHCTEFSGWSGKSGSQNAFEDKHLAAKNALQFEPVFVLTIGGLGCAKEDEAMHTAIKRRAVAIRLGIHFCRPRVPFTHSSHIPISLSSWSR